MAEEELVGDEEVQELADFLQEQAADDDLENAFIVHLRRISGKYSNGEKNRINGENVNGNYAI